MTERTKRLIDRVLQRLSTEGFYPLKESSYGYQSVKRILNEEFRQLEKLEKEVEDK